mgnify:CR=1 FL=1
MPLFFLFFFLGYLQTESLPGLHTQIDYDEQARAWAEENRKAVESAEAKATELQQQLDNVKTCSFVSFVSHTRAHAHTRSNHGACVLTIIIHYRMEGKEEKEWMDKKQSVQVAINQMSKVINEVAAKHQTTISLLSKR